MIHLLYKLLEPTFKQIISPYCLHLGGPSQVKHVTQAIRVALAKGFYFLGVRFEVPQRPQAKNQGWEVQVHQRSWHRALDRVRAMNIHVHPAHSQRYLTR